MGFYRVSLTKTKLQQRVGRLKTIRSPCAGVCGCCPHINRRHWRREIHSHSIWKPLSVWKTFAAKCRNPSDLLALDPADFSARRWHVYFKQLCWCGAPSNSCLNISCLRRGSFPRRPTHPDYGVPVKWNVPLGFKEACKRYWSRQQSSCVSFLFRISYIVLRSVKSLASVGSNRHYCNWLVSACRKIGFKTVHSNLILFIHSFARSLFIWIHQSYTTELTLSLPPKIQHFRTNWSISYVFTHAINTYLSIGLGCKAPKRRNGDVTVSTHQTT